MLTIITGPPIFSFDHMLSYCVKRESYVFLFTPMRASHRQDETKFIHSLITRSCEALRVASTFVGVVLVCAVLACTGRQALSQWVEG